MVTRQWNPNGDSFWFPQLQPGFDRRTWGFPPSTNTKTPTQYGLDQKDISVACDVVDSSPLIFICFLFIYCNHKG